MVWLFVSFLLSYLKSAVGFIYVHLFSGTNAVGVGIISPSTACQ
jgi:hypothetical protein